MSAVESIPKVQSVSSALVKEASSAAVVVSAGLAFLLLRALSAGAKQAYRAYSQPNSLSQAEIKPWSDVGRDYSVIEGRMESALEQSALLPTERIQLKTLLTLEQAPMFVQSQAVLEEKFDLLSRATSPQEAERQRQELLEVLGAEHRQVLGGALSLACANAAKKIGFSTLETKNISLECTRIIATDTAGRSLVTEIRKPKDKEPAIETEVVGVSDGTCNSLLDAFAKSLQEEGVRSAPSARKFTGGVCELAAAREFVRRKVSRGQSSSAQASSSKEAGQRRRAQLTNGVKQGRKG